jgi:lipopolysaccharide transport system ATP-binding protein
MHQLTSDGISILFVSHNLLAVADLCSRTLVMDRGQIVFDGPVDGGIARYKRDVATSGAGSAGEHVDWPSTALDVRINGQPLAGSVEAAPYEALRVDVVIDRPTDARPLDVVLNLVIESPDGRMVVHLRSDTSGVALRLLPGTNVLTARIDELPLAGGRYWLWLRLVSLDPKDPDIRDSARILLEVTGNQPMDAILLPRHRFEQSGLLGKAPAPGPLGQVQ